MNTSLRLSCVVVLLSVGARAFAGATPPPTPAPVAARAAAVEPAPVAPPADAPATTAVAASPAGADKALLVGLKVGGLFAQPFTGGRLGASYDVSLEVGYLLPVLERRLGLVLDVGYTEPGAKATLTDPRVDANGGSYSWTLNQRELMVGLTAIFRFPMGALTPYAGVGPRLWLLQTLVQGTAGDGNAISLTKEQSTKVGLAVPLGVGYALGPGSVFFEAQLLWAPLDHRITGASSVGSITTCVGYRLLF